MKILVSVAEVATVDDEFECSGTSIDDRFLTYDMNEWDDYAIEEAVQISEANDDVEVVTVTIGPERSEEVIRQALAKGADRAVRIWDDQLAEASLLDPATKAHLIAAVAREEDPDLILTGVQTGDHTFGATGVALAAQLEYGWAAVVNKLALEDDTVTVHRELEGGLEELTEVTLPAVLTIQTGINEPRYASLRGIRQAQSKPLDVQTPDDLGVAAGDLQFPLTLATLYEAVTESEATVFEGPSEETAGRLAELLHDLGVGA